MLIRATRHTCFVILKNGLTLELIYDHELIDPQPRAAPRAADPRARPMSRSQGVWMLNEEVLLEVQVGQS